MADNGNYAPFDGDGRLKQYPPAVRPLGDGRPTAVTNARAGQLIELFSRNGMSNHSQQLTTLWVLIAWCQHHKKPFEVWRWNAGDISEYGIFLGEIPTGISQQGATRVMKE